LLVYLLALAVVLVAALVAWGAALLLHLHGASLALLVILILLAGLAAAAVILIMHFRAKKNEGGGEADGGAGSELDLMLNDANRKLRTAQRGGPKSLDGLPLIYLLGQADSAKTTLVLRSGLEPELLAGTAPRESDVSPTPLLNLWFTRQAVILETGKAIRESDSTLARMVTRTRPKAYRSTFGSAAPPRAAVVCVSAEQFLAADAAASSLASARAIGAQLREISRLLGAALPVYVIVTKLDRVPHFAEYVRNLSNEEARQIFGAPLSRSEASAGVYADQASREFAAALDALCYSLGEFRLELLARETEQKNASGVYELPREFGKLRKNLNQYLVELCKPSQLSANPFLRGFYFTGVRALMVEQAAAAPAAAPFPTARQEVGATRMFSVQDAQAAYRAAAPPPASISTRAPQWTFLPRLFPEVILGDRSALSATQQTAPARLFRRMLFGGITGLLAIFAVLLLISYLNNSALERSVLNAARALPVAPTAPGSYPTLSDLQTLDQLRQTILQLDAYQQDGPPWTYRFGLYQGDALALRARRIYFDRFRPMLLNSTQANFVAYLRALPDTPAAGADYTAAYNPLKAYLITTTNPDKSTAQFLTPVFLQYWMGSRSVDPAHQSTNRFLRQ
jgi:type VI secretion system protein ImpL